MEIARFERQTGYKIKTVRTDGGTEFQGSFQKLLEDHGIRKIKVRHMLPTSGRERTYAHQPNGKDNDDSK